jgi:type VI secretion system protein ImpC
MSAEEEGQGAPAAEAATTTAEAGVLDQILDTMRARSDDQRTWGRDLVKELVAQLLDPKLIVKKDTEKTINARIGQIDALLSAQLTAIMHHPEFAKLEGSWHGLHHLVYQSETGSSLKIRVLNTSKKDLLNDLEKASEFDQSALFQRVYEAEYGMFGGEPYGALVGDFEFTNGSEDMALLERISNVAAAAHAPFIGAVNPEMFGLQSYTDIGKIRDMEKTVDTLEHVKWKSFRDTEDSRYVALVMPRTLARLPYGNKTKPVEEFDFEEKIDSHNDFCWSNAAFAYGTRLTDAFAKSGWCAAIRGVEGGGLVEGLPAYTFKDEDGDVVLKCPTEVAITDRREAEMDKLGFIALVHKKGSDQAAFFGAASTQKAKKYDRDAANANAALSTKINYMLCTSRFAHYLKAMARDKIGAFMEREECESWLNRWISNYVLENPESAGQKARAEKPLRAARVMVEAVKGKPGHYQAVAHLRPHFQLEALSADLRLVAELPAAKG